MVRMKEREKIFMEVDKDARFKVRAQAGCTRVYKRRWMASGITLRE